ncbi:hypothetical protein [Paenibacillus durus]|uniref:Uncharacterized protein n=1 Tax=Paenibacillus durus ATCC 35681 TaxID=1333534 RepID=A0A0F7FEH4_PAEDU|nr:hypothetical protein [Paenibacillus durus]AKG37345.1 hypothetical protein VK70_25040 [Paenibacillus durus ATCC 35681]
MEGYPINTKQISSLLGFSIPDDFVLDLEGEETLSFKQRIQEESVKPFPIESMKSLLRELSNKKKRTMAAYMKWPIRFNPKKPFPDVVFNKYLGAELQQKEGKQKLLIAILSAVLDLYDEEEESAEAFLAAQNEKIKEYGYWHYYWALRFYPDYTEEVQKRLLELAAGNGQSDDHRLAEPLNPAVVANKKHGVDMKKHIAALKRKLDRESDLRQKAEKEMKRLRNESRRQDKLAEYLSAEKSRHEEDLASAVDRVSRMQAALDGCRGHGFEGGSQNCLLF